MKRKRCPTCRGSGFILIGPVARGKRKCLRAFRGLGDDLISTGRILKELHEPRCPVCRGNCCCPARAAERKTMSHRCDFCGVDEEDADGLWECWACGREFCDHCGRVIDGICHQCVDADSRSHMMEEPRCPVCRETAPE